MGTSKCFEGRRLGSPVQKCNKNFVPPLSLSSFPHYPPRPLPHLFLLKKNLVMVFKVAGTPLSTATDVPALITTRHLQTYPSLPLVARRSKSPSMRCQVSCT